MKTILTAGVASLIAISTALPAAAAVNPLVEILLFPIVKLAEVQSSLQPEKDSCWNKGRRNVSLCGAARVVERNGPSKPE
jgi:hypothetical protein